MINYYSTISSSDRKREERSLLNNMVLYAQLVDTGSIKLSQKTDKIGYVNRGIEYERLGLIASLLAGKARNLMMALARLSPIFVLDYQIRGGFYII